MFNEVVLPESLLSKIWQFSFLINNMDMSFQGPLLRMLNITNLTGFFSSWIKVFLTLFRMGGGHYGPPYHESVRRFHRVRAKLTKTHDFVPLKNWKVPEESFFEFFLKIFWKLDVENFWGSSSMSRKIKKIEKTPFFCKKSYFFWLNLFCIHSELSFEVYNSCVAQNLKFRPFLA